MYNVNVNDMKMRWQSGRKRLALKQTLLLIIYKCIAKYFIIEMKLETYCRWPESKEREWILVL